MTRRGRSAEGVVIAGLAALTLVAGGRSARAAPATTAHASRWVPRRAMRPRDPPPGAGSNLAAEAFSDDDFNSCHKAAPGKRDVEVELKPDTDVAHLIVWISSITCRSFVWSGSLDASRRKVTVLVPASITPARAFRLFLDALGSVGLTVEPSGRFYQVIEAVKAKSKPIPLYGFDGHLIAYKRAQHP
ncbi:MAG TPA: hypothetical protein VHO06_16675 [Polyangia bacterium]|nr:hypothetical protein [Polyangia bacterium]